MAQESQPVVSDVARAVRQPLVERRARLEQAIAHSPGDGDLARLLAEVDNALERVEEGTYGLCEACHGTIEADRLAANPLLRFCIDHLSTAERRALEADLELASRIQNALLPAKGQRVGGWEAQYHYQAVGPVSGDYCDLIRADGEVLYFFIGDATGKGVSASIMMSQLHAMFRTLASLMLPVEQLLERANHVLCDAILSSHYATVIAGRAFPDGKIELANAGHCLPLLLRQGTVSKLDSTGLPLGMFCDSRYGRGELSLSSGDAMLLYSDGLSEAGNSDGEQYGDARLAQLVREAAAAEPLQLIAACLRDLAAFQAGAAHSDDLTLLALRRT